MSKLKIIQLSELSENYNSISWLISTATIIQLSELSENYNGEWQIGFNR